MNNETILLKEYVEDAKNQFSETQKMLSQIESSFHTRMDGKTTEEIISSIIGTIVWAVVFGVAAYILYENKLVNGVLLIATELSVFALLAFMFADSISDFSYYGKISKYKKSIDNLEKRVSLAESSIESNHNLFMKSKGQGWDYSLNASDSIPEEARTVEKVLSNMDSIKKGFIKDVKTGLYYVSAFLITIIGCLALFSESSQIIMNMTRSTLGANLSGDLITFFNYLGLVIVLVGEYILIKWAWSSNSCNVTNVSLFFAIPGPLVFIILIAVVTFLVNLIITIIYIALCLAALAAAVACGCAMSSGS